MIVMEMGLYCSKCNLDERKYTELEISVAGRVTGVVVVR